MAIKLLYVEDNPFSVRLMQLYLRRQYQYKLLIATDGRSGCDMALLHEPDLILVDINLPDMTGWELTRKLKSYTITRHTPIIAITSLNMRESYELSLQSGIDLHINKMTHHTKIIQQMNELVNQKQTAG